MAEHEKTTYFAPAERTDKEEIERERKEILDHVLKDPFTCRIVDSVMEIVMILDKNRQVVFTNEALHKLLGSKDGSEFRGLRPGEVFHCVHSDEMKAGCGTSEHCRKCGAVISILSAQEGKLDNEECTVVQRGTDNAIELAVSAVPLDVDGERYTLFVILDVSDQKRREAMERIFFHDVLNTSAILSGLAEILQMGKDDKFPDLRGSIYKTTMRLIEELQAQRALALAEKGELCPHAEHIHSHDVIQDTIKGYASHDIAKDKALELDASSENIELDIDPTILHRVVGNMIKNALEASKRGEHVRVGSLKKNGFAEFWVHNDAVMPEDVQLQVFKRSFTTKGKGRGLGTYGIKLLTERYLKGEVGFESSQGKGTTFFARYPIKI